jgi:hypothetical protein
MPTVGVGTSGAGVSRMGVDGAWWLGVVLTFLVLSALVWIFNEPRG